VSRTGIQTSQEQLAEFVAQRAVLQSIASGAPLRETLTILTQQIERCTVGLKATVMLVEGRRLRSAAGPSLPEEYNRVADGIPIGEGFGSCGTAAHRGKQVIVRNIQEDPLWKNYRDIAQRYGLSACWSTPILSARGEVLGTFALYYGEPRNPEPEELRLVQELSLLAAIAIERQRAGESLDESERRFGELIEGLDAVYWEAEPEPLRYTYVSPRVEELLGHAVARWLSDPALWASLIHEDDREPTLRRRHEALQEPRDYECEYRVRAGDGRVVWLRELVQVKRAPGGAWSLRGVMLDVTPQHETELAREALLGRVAESQALLQATVEQMPQGVIIVAAPSGTVLMANDRAQRILGFPVKPGEKLAPYSWLPLFHRDGEPAAAQVWPLMRAFAGEAVSEETELIRADGTRGALVVSARPAWDTSGGVVAGVVVLSDVSEARQVERTQRFLAEASAKLVDSLDAATIARTVVSLSVAELADWCSLFSFTDGDDGALRCLASAHRDATKARLVCELERLVAPCEERPLGLAQVLANGEPQLVSQSGEAPFAPSGRQPEVVRLLRVLGTTATMTVALKTRSRTIGAMVFGSSQPHRRYGAGELLVAQELAQRVALALDNARLYREGREAVRRRDRFLAVAAHELNTPLTSLMLRLQSMLLDFNKPCVDLEMMRERARVAEQQTTRLARLVSELLDVSRMRADRLSLDRESMDLVEVVRAAVVRLHAEIAAKGIDVAVHAPTPVIGKWDRSRLEQVITNLISNAVKYGRGGPVRVTVEADDTTARLSVEDEGIGMSPELMKRIFRPFERGGDVGQYGGLGLGLYITDQLVRAHGGLVRVHSAPGQGSTFIIELPRSAAPPIA
jgi:PAS domain S-box-containing protein